MFSLRSSKGSQNDYFICVTIIFFVDHFGFFWICKIYSWFKSTNYMKWQFSFSSQISHLLQVTILLDLDFIFSLILFPSRSRCAYMLFSLFPYMKCSLLYIFHFSLNYVLEFIPCQGRELSHFYICTTLWCMFLTSQPVSFWWTSVLFPVFCYDT